MSQRGGAEHLYRRAEVLKNIGFDAGAAAVALGDSDSQPLRALLNCGDEAVQRSALQVKNILVAYAGERLISNTMVCHASRKTVFFEDPGQLEAKLPVHMCRGHLLVLQTLIVVAIAQMCMPRTCGPADSGTACSARRSVAKTGAWLRPYGRTLPATPCCSAP